MIAAPFVNPPCPACGGATERAWSASAAVRPDAFPGGRVIENLGDRPVVVYSRSDLAREARARGLQSFVRHVPVPGTDKSPHTTSWAAPSAWMLEQAALLLARVGAHDAGTREPSEGADPGIAFAGHVATTTAPPTIARAGVARVIREM